MSFEINKLDNIHLDILKEIANIGSGNAITSLSIIVNKSIQMDVPKVNIIDFNQVENILGGADQIVVGIYLEFNGEIDGTIMFLLDKTSAEELLSLLFDKRYNSSEYYSDIEISALQEIGNILTGSFLCALSKLTNLRVKHSVPGFSMDMAGAILSVPMIEFGKQGDKALFIETDFIYELKQVKGHIFLIPSISSYSAILKSLGVV